MMGRVGRSACWLDRDPTRMVEAGYGPTTGLTRLILSN
jgi:hypothetical protein